MANSTTVELVAASLREVFALLDARFEESPAALARRPAAAGAWSVHEHLEHVCLANHFLLLTIGKGCRKAVSRAAFSDPPAGESDLAALAPIAVPGAFDWEPPVHMIPTGQRPAGEIRAELRDQLARSLQVLESLPRGEGRLCTIWMSVHGLGRLDMYQWLYFLAQHARYHLALIDRC